MSGVIASLLDEVSAKRAEAAQVHARIEEVAGDLLKEEARLVEEAEGIVKEAKKKAEYIPDSQAHTLIGRFLKLVWRPASTERKLDRAKVKELLVRHGIDPEVLETCEVEVETRKATWALTAVK